MVFIFMWHTFSSHNLVVLIPMVMISENETIFDIYVKSCDCQCYYSYGFHGDVSACINADVKLSKSFLNWQANC